MEIEKAEIACDMRTLKGRADASAIPEQRLQDLLQEIISSDDDSAALLSAVYRVEVSADVITIWPLLDADPTGTIDHTLEGVTITPEGTRKGGTSAHTGAINSPVGSDPSAACGGKSEVSEWPRPTDAKALRRRKMSGTATGRFYYTRQSLSSCTGRCTFQFHPQPTVVEAAES